MALRAAKASNNVVQMPLAPAQAGRLRKSPASPPRPCRSITPVPLDLRLAEELEFASRQVEQALAVLAQDPMFRRRYGWVDAALASVRDNMAGLSTVVRAADKEAAVDCIRQAELRARLQRRPIRPILG